MKRMVLAVSLVFAVAGMCGGGGEMNEDPVVVPVNTDDDANEEEDEGYWCCEYKDDGGSSQYALTEGPAECNTTYSEKGRWISGNQCIPTCCKSPNDPEDEEAGFTFELTTPKSCVAGSGELLASDSEECEVESDKPKKATPRAKPRPRTVTKPGGGATDGRRR